MPTILVVDDEISILKMIQQALLRFGYTVETAVSGEDALEKLNHANYDLIVTDVCMPEIDGLDLVSMIRRSTMRATPVIGISGTPWLLSDKGFDAVLSKPFSLKTLVDLIGKLTGNGQIKEAASG